MKIGEKLKKARKAKGFTQDELADKLKIDRNVIGRLERDGTSLSLDLAVTLADILGVTLDYLARDADNTVKREEFISEQYVHQLKILTQLSPTDVPHVLAVLDAFVTKAQLQSIIK